MWRLLGVKLEDFVWEFNVCRPLGVKLEDFWCGNLMYADR